MTDKKNTPRGKRTKPAPTPAPIIHAPKQYDGAVHFISERLVGFLPHELRKAAELVNEKALHGLIMGPPTHKTAVMVCEMFGQCLWVVTPPDTKPDESWALRLTPGPVFNTENACEVMRWDQHTTSGAAYHQGLAIFAAGLVEVAKQSEDFRNAFNKLKGTWTDQALTALHRAVW